MKKALIIASALFLTGLTTKAQTQKGYYLIGGNIANISGNTNAKSFNFALSPKVAWFIQDNLAIGGEVDLGVAALKGASTQFTYFVGPMARYYFGPVAELQQTRWFVEANAGIGGANGGGNSTNGFEAGAGPGLAYFISESVALEALAKAGIATGGGNTGVAFKPSLNLGFQIYLPTSKVKALRNQVR